MEIIKDTKLVESMDPSMFQKELEEAIEDFQSQGLEVEVQYASPINIGLSPVSYSILYSALVIGRQKSFG